MRSSTKKGLSLLEKARWFNAVGEPYSGDFARVYSWEDALALFSLPYPDIYSDVLLTMKEEYRHRLREVEIEEWRKWNRNIDEIDPHIEDLVKRKLGNIIISRNLPKEFSIVIANELCLFLLECEFMRFVKPGFFTQLASHYMAGHWPCGWEGETLSGGRLVIF